MTMAKRPSLFANATAQPAPSEPQPPLPQVEAKRPTTRPPSREGKRVLSIYLPPEAWKQLRLLSLNTETSTQALGEEAINLLFEKHRLNRIA
ncbi:MAG: ribbon-helix-helix domain-containing protein [Candidatus Korobacteraceae bacterium]